LAAQLPEDIEELRTATQKAIQSSLKTAIPITAQEFYPCSSRLIIGGSCKEMAKALFGDVEYMLKLKSALKGNAQNEAFAGEKIRLAAVQEIVKFLGESLSIESDQVPTGLEYLAFIVAPIDCGDHIASRKILNAIELKEIIMTQTKSQSPISSKKETPIEGLPLPDFNDFESQDLLRNSFKSMDFGNAQQRIEMFKILTKIVKFLNNNGIFHNDLNSGNFLIEDNKYFRIYVIDFDRAKFKASNNDSQKFPELCLEYLLHSTKSCSLEDIISSWKNEFPFSYTSEELKQIKKLYITAHSVELQQD
ncbi:MAG: hypothetical protein LBS71_00285, partial [Puniceicoccales bacterium]|nr:hypothetical protein [Puniceicoccales bacterium]